jgi:hypothetical protein
LSEIEIRTGAVTNGHGLAELALGPEAVEDNAVDGDDKDLDNDFDDAANESPVLEMLVDILMLRTKDAYLKTADEGISNVILKEMSSPVVHARPTPHVFIVVLRFTLVEDGCTNTPHDDAEDEESYGEDGVVGSHLFGPMVTSSPVGHDDDD